MKPTFAQIFLAAGAFLFLSQGAPAYAINTPQDVDLPIGAGESQAVLVTASIPATSSTASVNKVGMDSESTGTGNGTGAINTGLVDNATGGTTNDAATFSGGNVGIGTTSPATPLKPRINGPVKAAGTGSGACTASDLGAMRYNSTGQYVEICTGP